MHGFAPRPTVPTLDRQGIDPVLTTPAVRLLDSRELTAVLEVLARDPVANAFVTARVLDSRLDPRRLGGEMWGWYHQGELAALCFAGANLVPVGAGPAALRAFAERALAQGRRCSSIVGPADQVEELWGYLERPWGPPRLVRSWQPLMVIDSPPAGVTADPRVRRVRRGEMEVVMPACVAMFTEEVGVSPLSAVDGGLAYQSRVAETVGEGRCFARMENGRVVFKAEIGAVTPAVCQLQGVWTAPDRRGRGLATAGLAQVIRHALEEAAPVVSLYVNDFNEPALATYRRLGFREVGALRSIMF